MNELGIWDAFLLQQRWDPWTESDKVQPLFSFKKREKD